MSISTIKSVETNRYEPRISTLALLADALNVTPETLTSGEMGKESVKDKSEGERLEALAASFQMLRNMSPGKLQAVREMLEVFMALPDDEYQNRKPR